MKLFDVIGREMLGGWSGSGLGRALAAAALSVCMAPAAQAQAQAQAGKITPRVLEQLRANPAQTKSLLVQNKIEWCGTMQGYYRNNPEARIAMQQGKACQIEGQPDLPAVRNAAIPNASTVFKTIRVVFHYFTNDDGSMPTSSQATVDGALKQLNLDYAKSRIRFVSTSTNVHRSTRFREPKTDKDGLEAVIEEMKRTYAIDPLHQLNVYVFELQTANPLLLGAGTFPWDANALQKGGGFYCDNDAFGLGKRTATHEIGHCLGLWHPFRGFQEVEDGCIGCREVAGRTPVDGDLTGDYCSDTPATPKSFECGPPAQDESIPQTDPCNGKPWGVTDFRNYMGYADDTCIDHFTAQQNGRMRAWIDARLKTWLVADAASNLPTVTATSPTGRVLKSRPAISVTFSLPMNRASVQAAFSLSPSVAGTFSWSADSKTMTFTPTVALASGTLYTARVLGSAKSATGQTLDGNGNGKADSALVDAVSWSFTVAGAPPNDAFAKAQVLTGITGRVTGSTLEATKERGEPNHGGDLGGASIWYRWTAPAAGNVTFSTINTRFDTTLGAYSGTSVSALRTLASNNNSGTGSTSTVNFSVTAGQVVYVAIDGARDKVTMLPASGPTNLFWSLQTRPANDDVASAQVIAGGAGSVRGTNRGATVEPGESSPLKTPGAAAVASVWYRWKAPSSGNFTFKTGTETEGLDTVLGIYNAVGRTLVVANDNEGDGHGTLKTSSVELAAVAGKEYLIVVDGAQGAQVRTGIFRLTWSPTPSQPSS